MLRTMSGAAQTIIDLVVEGALDSELAGLLWLLVEDGVPLTVTGPASIGTRDRVARAILSVPPRAAWVLIDADAERPGPGTLGARIRAGVHVGLTLEAGDLRQAMERLAAPPDGLPEDAVRRLGVVLVVAEVPSTAVGPVRERVRVLAAHYLRPTERDPQGHVQRRPPAVLATWDAERDAFDHFAWGVTPELAILVDRTQASLEALQAGRRQSIERLVADPPVDAERALAAIVAGEPPRQHAAVVPATAGPTFRSPLTDPHIH